MLGGRFQTFYIWGDSLLKGIVFDEGKKRYSVLENNGAVMLAKRLGIEVINRAKMGCTATKGKELLARDLEKGVSCQGAVLEFGGNDSDFHWDAISAAPEQSHLPKTPLPQFREDMTEMITMIRGHGITPVLMTLPPIDSERYFDFISRGLNPSNILQWLGEKQVIHNFHKQYSVTLEELAREQSCPLVDVRSAFLAQKDFRSYMCSDGIHPNEKGHKLMQEVFLRYAGTLG